MRRIQPWFGTWHKFECDHGARWVSIYKPASESGECRFSGCAEGHRWHYIGATNDRGVAETWFRRGDES